MVSTFKREGWGALNKMTLSALALVSGIFKSTLSAQVGSPKSTSFSGTRGAGQVIVYEEKPTGWVQIGPKIEGTSQDMGFGTTVALSFQLNSASEAGSKLKSDHNCEHIDDPSL